MYILAHTKVGNCRVGEKKTLDSWTEFKHLIFSNLLFLERGRVVFLGLIGQNLGSVLFKTGKGLKAKHFN